MKNFNNITLQVSKDSLAIAIGEDRKNAKPVLCIDTGLIYASLTDAAEDVGVTVTALSNCLRGKTNSCKGMSWCFVQESANHIDDITGRIRQANAEAEDAKDEKDALKEYRRYTKELFTLREKETKLKQELEEVGRAIAQAKHNLDALVQIDQNI